MSSTNTDLMRNRKPITKREKWARSFTNEFVKNHLDKLEEVDKLPEPLHGSANIEWEANDYNWVIYKMVLKKNNEPDLLEYRLIRRTKKMTKSVNEKIYGDSCWVIRLSNLLECTSHYERGKTCMDNTMNTHNMNHSGFNFNGYSSKHPPNTLPDDI